MKLKRIRYESVELLKMNADKAMFEAENAISEFNKGNIDGKKYDQDT